MVFLSNSGRQRPPAGERRAPVHLSLQTPELRWGLQRMRPERPELTIAGNFDVQPLVPPLDTGEITSRSGPTERRVQPEAAMPDMARLKVRVSRLAALGDEDATRGSVT